MARFNLEDYETVESRIKKFTELHPDGRIITKLEWNTETAPMTFLMKAYIYLDAGEQALDLPKATGYAIETEGTGGANNGSAAENSETSAIGRALANMALSGNKRASREEMQKVTRVESRDFIKESEAIMDKDTLRALYGQAKASGVPKQVLDKLRDRAETL